jgi:formylmethanofuran dehydrogenase subunit E
VAVRGPSRSGKTTLCERLVAELSELGLHVAWLKRTHHLVDIPGKSSDRVWRTRPAATMLRAADRVVVTLPPGNGEPSELVAALPGEFDIVLFETHTPLPQFPTLLSTRLSPGPGEEVVGTWTFREEAIAARNAVPAILALLPQDRELDRALRAAMRLHGGHACAGLVLGTRLALAGAAALGVEVPDTMKRLIVVSETDRCAVDGLQAVTGCRPGKRTLRLLDYGKLAATFLDEHSGRAVRVASRGDLRERVNATGSDRHAVQREAYATWPVEELFTFEDSNFCLDQYDRPGPPRARILCAGCGEEVSDGRHRETEMGPQCVPCAAAHTGRGVFA